MNGVVTTSSKREAMNNLINLGNLSFEYCSLKVYVIKGDYKSTYIDEENLNKKKKHYESIKDTLIEKKDIEPYLHCSNIIDPIVDSINCELNTIQSMIDDLTNKNNVKHVFNKKLKLIYVVPEITQRYTKIFYTGILYKVIKDLKSHPEELKRRIEKLNVPKSKPKETDSDEFIQANKKALLDLINKEEYSYLKEWKNIDSENGTYKKSVYGNHYCFRYEPSFEEEFNILSKFFLKRLKNKK